MRGCLTPCHLWVFDAAQLGSTATVRPLENISASIGYQVALNSIFKIRWTGFALSAVAANSRRYVPAGLIVGQTPLAT